MDTWLKVVIGGAVAYFAYEMFYGSSSTTAPASWTSAGGTAAQWTALSATGQAYWNSLPATSQTGTAAISVMASYPATSTESVSTTAATTAATTAPAPAARAPAFWHTGQAPSSSCAAGFVFSPTVGRCVQAGGSGGNMAVGFPGYPGVTSLATLASAIQSLAASDPYLENGVMPTGDHWNYYANMITGKTVPVAWPAGPLTFTQYWAAESPVVAAQTGLGSIMAGLRALIQHGRTAGMGAYVQQTEQQAFASDAAGPMTPFFFDADTANRSWN